MVNFIKNNWFPILLVVSSFYSFNGYGAYSWKLLGSQKYVVGGVELLVAIYLFWMINRRK